MTTGRKAACLYYLKTNLSILDLRRNTLVGNCT